jgi:hypothetical protein
MKARARNVARARHRAALATLFALLLAGAEQAAGSGQPQELVVGRRDAARQVVEQHMPALERPARARIPYRSAG